MQRFGEKLRLLRTQHNLTLRELAAALGYVSHSSINLVEIGKKKPTIDLVMKTAHYFQVTPDQLLRDDLDLDLGSATTSGADDTRRNMARPCGLEIPNVAQHRPYNLPPWQADQDRSFKEQTSIDATLWGKVACPTTSP